MKNKYSFIPLASVILLNIPKIAPSAALPACLDGYAFHGRKLMMVSIDTGQTGNGAIGSNLEIQSYIPYNIGKGTRTWNGNFISSGYLVLHNGMVVNGNLSSNIVATVDGTFNYEAINGNITSSGNVFVDGNVQVTGNIRAGGNGFFNGDPNATPAPFINGNVFVPGNSSLVWTKITGDYYVGGTLGTDFDLCKPGSKPVFVGGTYTPKCAIVSPLPIPSPFSPIALIDSCKYIEEPVQVGLNDFSIGANDRVTLPPGAYKSVGIRWAFLDPKYAPIPGDTNKYPQRGCLKLNSGSYSMEKLWVPSGTCLELNTADGNIEINVRDTLLLRGPNPIRFLGLEEPSKFKIYFAGTAVKIRQDKNIDPTDTLPSRLLGTLYAPNAELNLVNETIIGTVYAKALTLSGKFSNKPVPYIVGPIATGISIRNQKASSKAIGHNLRQEYVIPGSRNIDASGKVKAYNTLGKIVGHVDALPAESVNKSSR